MSSTCSHCIAAGVFFFFFLMFVYMATKLLSSLVYLSSFVAAELSFRLCFPSSINMKHLLKLSLIYIVYSCYRSYFFHLLTRPWNGDVLWVWSFTVTQHTISLLSIKAAHCSGWILVSTAFYHPPQGKYSYCEGEKSEDKL